MKCPRCQAENPPSSNFCLGYAARLGATRRAPRMPQRSFPQRQRILLFLDPVLSLC